MLGAGLGGEGLRFGCFSTQKPVNRPGWLKGKFALFQMLATGRGKAVADFCLKANSPTPDNAAGENVYKQRWGSGGTPRRNSTVISRLVISGLTSTIVIILGAVKLQFQAPFLPISLQSVLRIVASCVLDTVWWSCFGIYKTAHRIWLRIVSPRERAKVLDYDYDYIIIL